MRYRQMIFESRNLTRQIKIEIELTLYNRSQCPESRNHVLFISFKKKKNSSVLRQLVLIKNNENFKKTKFWIGRKLNVCISCNIYFTKHGGRGGGPSQRRPHVLPRERHREHSVCPTKQLKTNKIMYLHNSVILFSLHPLH